ncbi:sulfotransferase 1A1-like [Glandiceps talaboti]
MAAGNQKVELESSDFYWHQGYYYPNNIDRGTVETIRNFSFKDGDVLVASFPKSGTNWMMQILMKMYDDWGLCMVGDQRDASALDWLSFSPSIKTFRHDWKKAFMEQMDTMTAPRLLRSHFPPEVLRPETHTREKRLKIIYVSRNPKDVCVSWYKFTQDFSDGCWAASDMEEAITNFVKGSVFNGPWLDYVTSWYKLDRNDGVLHVKYEDMKRHTKSVISEITDFLNRPLPVAKLEDVAESSTFEAMKSNEKIVLMTQDVKDFLRKGRIGDWKNYFTVAQNEYFDREITQKLAERGIDFIYE